MKDPQMASQCATNFQKLWTACLSHPQSDFKRGYDITAKIHSDGNFIIFGGKIILKEEDLEIEHRIKVPQGVNQIFQESDQKLQVNFQLANSFYEILEQRCKPLSETLLKGAKV